MYLKISLKQNFIRNLDIFFIKFSLSLIKLFLWIISLIKLVESFLKDKRVATSSLIFGIFLLLLFSFKSSKDSFNSSKFYNILNSINCLKNDHRNFCQNQMHYLCSIMLFFLKITNSNKIQSTYLKFAFRYVYLGSYQILCFCNLENIWYFLKLLITRMSPENKIFIIIFFYYLFNIY